VLKLCVMMVDNLWPCSVSKLYVGVGFSGFWKCK
jgi:hypothetical protein